MLLLSAFCLLPSAFCLPPPFRFDTDTFSFANQTVYVYPRGYAEKRALKPGEKPPAFTLRCFAMCRSVEQFRKFARFRSLPCRRPMTTLRSTDLLRRVNRRAVWRPALPPERAWSSPATPTCAR